MKPILGRIGSEKSYSKNSYLRNSVGPEIVKKCTDIQLETSNKLNLSARGNYHSIQNSSRRNSQKSTDKSVFELFERKKALTSTLSKQGNLGTEKRPSGIPKS
jgi:hypothetical protein